MIGVAAGAAKLSFPTPEPHQNDAAPQHWNALFEIVCRDLCGLLPEDEYEVRFS
jgi:hypothetical protein